MKIKFFLGIVFLCLLIANTVFAAEKIDNFSSRIVVNKDSTIDVIETITVTAEGDQIKHGIYRDFPTIYAGSDGKRVKIDFTLQETLLDGKPVVSQEEGLSNGLRIYLGDKDKLLAPGEYTYTIKYQAGRELGFFMDHDELYWNVTGNGWVFPIEKASAEVVLPEGVGSSSIKLAAYTGPTGSKDTNYLSDVTSQHTMLTARFETAKALGAGEGLTIVVGWPKGYVTQPAARIDLVGQGYGKYVALAGLILALIYWLWAWKKYGRDPRKGTIIPLYEAPTNLSPAAIRYIKSTGFNNKCLAAAIISLAVKGYLRIEQRESGILVFKNKIYYLIKIKDPDPSLSSDEVIVLKEIFASGNEVALEQSAERPREAAKQLGVELAANFRKDYFSWNIGRTLLGLPIIIAGIIVALGLEGELAAPLDLLAIIASGFIGIILFVIFLFLIRAYTPLGRQTVDEIEGFKWFLSVTEKDRMNFHNPPERTPELFEKFLPFALALGVENKWAEQFAAVFAKLGEEYKPSWSNVPIFVHGSFVNFDSSFVQTIAASAAAPGSSSGFGGSSGGGGGGGGGGGW